jgi:hypothetical protein
MYRRTRSQISHRGSGRDYGSSIPPVGMNPTPGYTLLSARNIPTPPAASAGKNFRTRRSRLVARLVSSKPGDMMKRAPASLAAQASVTLVTVPAPTRRSGRAEQSSSIAAAAAAVRDVISAHGAPPRSSAPQQGDGLFDIVDDHDWDHTVGANLIEHRHPPTSENEAGCRRGRGVTPLLESPASAWSDLKVSTRSHQASDSTSR